MIGVIAFVVCDLLLISIVFFLSDGKNTDMETIILIPMAVTVILVMWCLMTC